MKNDNNQMNDILINICQELRGIRKEISRMNYSLKEINELAEEITHDNGHAKKWLRVCGEVDTYRME